jgi:regulator of sirC expression with transglutaminase-like and TPR domain
MPGHFLLRDKVDPGVFVDPFHRGAFLDERGCRRLYHRLAGRDAPWDEAYLNPVDRPGIVARMLANLKALYSERNDLDSLRWVMRLRVAVPGVPSSERDEFARLMAPLN